jgi:hypothetical protein
MKLSHLLSKASLLAAVCLGGTAAARDSEEHQDKALVLGDSVAFGYIAAVSSAERIHTRPRGISSASPTTSASVCENAMAKMKFPGCSTIEFEKRIDRVTRRTETN